jgi:hypothetical protein
MTPGLHQRIAPSVKLGRDARIFGEDVRIE